MRLLICTQAVDMSDPLLGFFHGWVKEFSQYFDSIYVICLKEGVHSLPSNVQVYSLGKEHGESRLKYIFRFYKYIFLLRNKYDVVFTHMNPHYVLLGCAVWIWNRVPVYFWRNHARMNIMTALAARCTRKIFYTSPFACTSRYAHAFQMPVGIDCSLFAPAIHSRVDTFPKKILFLGRVSRVKRPELLIEAATFLPQQYEVHVYGDDPSNDQKYRAQLIEKSGQNVFFHEGITNAETSEVYRAHDIYINLTPEGSMDKTVLEAVACEVPVIVTNTSFKNILPTSSILTDSTPEQLAKKIIEIINQPKIERELYLKKSRKYVQEHHSLQQLASEIYNHML